MVESGLKVLYCFALDLFVQLSSMVCVYIMNIYYCWCHEK